MTQGSPGSTRWPCSAVACLYSRVKPVDKYPYDVQCGWTAMGPVGRYANYQLHHERGEGYGYANTYNAQAKIGFQLRVSAENGRAPRCGKTE